MPNLLTQHPKCNGDAVGILFPLVPAGFMYGAYRSEDKLRNGQVWKKIWDLGEVCGRDLERFGMRDGFGMWEIFGMGRLWDLWM